MKLQPGTVMTLMLRFAKCAISVNTDTKVWDDLRCYDNHEYFDHFTVAIAVISPSSTKAQNFCAWLYRRSESYAVFKSVYISIYNCTCEMFEWWKQLWWKSFSFSSRSIRSHCNCASYCNRVKWTMQISYFIQKTCLHINTAMNKWTYAHASTTRVWKSFSIIGRVQIDFLRWNKK